MGRRGEDSDTLGSAGGAFIDRAGSNSPIGAAETWNRRYASVEELKWGTYDAWLDRWAGLLKQKQGKALDLGCGRGADTEVLLELGFAVTAIDFSSEALRLCRARNPQAKLQLKDISEGIGLNKASFSAVIANLSLHYFPKETTGRIFSEIGDLLEVDGIFAFRVNALPDTHYGSAEQVRAWVLHDVDGIQKQFFTESMVREAIGEGFEILSVARMKTKRFGEAKILWECIARKKAE